MFDADVELHIKGINIDWNKIDSRSYLRDIESIAGVSDLMFHKPITFFVGENGSGKSTMLEAIAVAYGFNPEGGTKNYSFSTYDSHSELCNAIRLIRGYNKPGWGYFLRAESFYNVASAEEVYSREGGRQPEYYHRKSHGESFDKQFTEQFGSLKCSELRGVLRNKCNDYVGTAASMVAAMIEK